MTELGKVPPPNSEKRLSLLDRAVLVLRNPENRNLEPPNRAKIIARVFAIWWRYFSQFSHTKYYLILLNTTKIYTRKQNKY
eukprot:1190410-Prorocentrum_minimum.AAC.4